MHVLWFEFILALRRLVRRRTQNGLMLLTFAVSVTLTLLSWSLFRTVYLSQPAFDPHGDYYVLAHADVNWAAANQMTLEEVEAYKGAPNLFADFAELSFYASNFIGTPNGDERVLGANLSSHALQITGARPIKGSLFTPADDKYGAAPRILLSERFWIDHFGSDPDVVGKPIMLRGEPATIVGVLSSSYRFPNQQDIWINVGALYNHPRWPMRTALVKLKPGVSKAQAESALQAILATMPATETARERGTHPVLVHYRDLFLVPDVRISALILFALSLLFLAVSCANAANLMIIDFLGRRPEVAASLALGIPRRAAIRSVCWQVGVIALAATGVALAVMPLAAPLLYDRIQMVNGPFWMAYYFSWSDVGIGLLLAGVSALVTMIAPIVYLLLVDPEKIIRDHAYASRGSGRAVWRRILLTGQVALLTVLGVSAALLVRANRNVGEAHRGYDAGRVFTAKISCLSIDFPDATYKQDRLTTHRKALEEIRRQPATEAAALAEYPLGYSVGPDCTYTTDSGGQPMGQAFFSHVSEGLFDTLGVPFVTGEDFPANPSDEGPPYAIINASLAEKLWPRQGPLGRTLFVSYPKMRKGTPPVQLIVRGVVADFQADGPRAKTNDAIFTPYLHREGALSALNIYVRDHSGVPTVRSVNDTVHRAEPQEALYFPSTVKAQIDLTLNSVRMTMDLTSVFAAAAVLLCAIGIYSLTVTQVLQSSRDFGIRMALGAEPGRLWRYFTRSHLVTALTGVALGLVGASQLVRVLQSLLYGVNPYHPATYAGVASAIVLVAVLACVPSLFRLRRINPADCLRSL